MPDEGQQKPSFKFEKDWQQADPLGKFILEKLIENGLTKNDLARALHLDRGRLPALLDGNRGLTRDELSIIANLLRVSLFDLVRHMISNERDAEIIYFVDTYLSLGEKERQTIKSMIEDFSRSHSGEAESP